MSKRLLDIMRELNQRFQEPRVIKDDNGNVITTMVYKGITTHRREWANEVILELIQCPDKYFFDTILSDNYLTPEQCEWRTKHGITLIEYKEDLLLANSQIQLVDNNAKPLNDVQLRWLEEWFKKYAKEPQPSPSVQATAKDDAALPDFLHMESYTQTIKFDMSALYTFLINESVIADIDLKLFTDCITHAHMNEVWKVGNHHKLKCVFRHVKDHFPNDWIDVVAQNMHTTRKNITAFQRDKIRDFERKLREIV